MLAEWNDSRAWPLRNEMRSQEIQETLNFGIQRAFRDNRTFIDVLVELEPGLPAI